MRIRTVLTLSLMALLALPLAATPVAAEPGGEIAWEATLEKALAKAKSADRVVMVCINDARPGPGGRIEPAAKALREVVYKDARVVERAKGFVCVLLSPAGSSADFGILRELGIEGQIVSPQHLFLEPAGPAILLRRQYWSYGSGETGIKKLLGMMDEAAKALQTLRAGPADGPADQDDVPEEAPEPEAPAVDPEVDRQAWVKGRITRILSTGGEKRLAVIAELARADKEGDCVVPLLDVLDDNKKDLALHNDVIRGLGVDGLKTAALGIAEHLTHKDMLVRANAAVSLEYIGCRDKKVVSALRKAAGKAKDVGLANHVYRALGRCGVEDSKARALLLKRAGSAKSEFASYGPCIGLAYFEGDAKAARGVEKLLKIIGVPGSRRGGGQNIVKRGLVSWTLAEIGHIDSGAFMRKELLARLDNIKAFWVEGLRGFWEAVARCCEGERGILPGIETGVRGFVQFAVGGNLGRYGAETRVLMDDARKGRDTTRFKPKGDGMLSTEGDM